MSRADDYRKQALQCREMAAQTRIGFYRDQLLRMAESWEQLANHAEPGVGRPRPMPRNDNDEGNEPGQ